MELFCLGIRNGSQSMMKALEQLGYRTYFMGGTIQYYSHLRDWRRHATGKKKLDLQHFLGDWDASVGHPVMMYPEDLIEAFPEVKVVLLERDDDSWFDSYRRFYKTIRMFGTTLSFIPRLRAIHALISACTFSTLGEGLEGRQDEVVARRTALYARATDLLPEDRVLRFRVQQGWEPLCSFLGKPVPNEDFPWINKGEAYVKKRVSLALARDLGWAGTAVGLLCWFGLTPMGLGLVAGELALFLLFFALRKA